MNHSKRIKAVVLLFIFLHQAFAPTLVMALTGGPSQPEVQSFEPAGTTEMVDLSSGTFTYNIPLLDVDGYPVNLSYHSGSSMDEEASCVGLGWNINPGVINRNMRGLPDDFDGEEIKKEFNLKPQVTWGGSFGLETELFGFDKLQPSLQAGVFYNNYKGIGLEFGLGISPSLSAAAGSNDHLTAGLGFNLNVNLNSQNGTTASAGIRPSLGYGERTQDKSHKEFSLSGGLNYNSRQGLMSSSMGINFQGSTLNKKNQIHSSSNGLTASYSFARPTFTPSPNMSITNRSITLRGAVSGEIFGAAIGANQSAYYSRQELFSKVETAKSYGSLYLHNNRAGSSLLDFNREKDGPFNQNTPNLAVPVPTQDIYNVSGQGIGGSYLLKRGDIGIFSDKESQVTSGSGNFGIEVGVGNLTKIGADIVLSTVEARNGAWKNDNGLTTNLGFKAPESGSLYEAAYFKPAGEQVAESNPALFNSVGGFDVVDAKIAKDPNDKFKVEVKPEFRKGRNLSSLPVTGGVNRTVRERRNQNISYLTAQEAGSVGLHHKIQNYALNNFSNSAGAIELLDRVSSIRKSNHISEVTTVREDGIRYVYGIAAYNNFQHDYHFSVNGSGDCATGLVTYTNTEITKNNTSGRDHYYSKEEIPGYAHSYLLTAVLSPEYADVDDIKGPSQGDIGTFTKFNYTRLYNNYKWRLPMASSTNKANFSPGLLSDPLDNKGSVVYGEKEIWQLHSIESKNFVARFYYSPRDNSGNERKDGLGVANLAGLPDPNQKLVKLDSIVLFSKIDLQMKGIGAIPLKKVTFEYDYSLSKNVPNTVNGTQGKLTLKKVYFNYGRSQKGRFSPYIFEYKGLDQFAGNPNALAYNYLSYNRWGTFQKSEKSVPADCNTSSPPGNDEAPYVKQDSILQAQYAVAWNLTAITLPSGGKIEVTYESHEYAYVQNRPAMEMFQVEGFGSSEAFGAKSNNLYTNPASQNNYLFFKLKTPLANLSAAQAKDIISRDYLKDIGNNNLYFKCHVDLKTTFNLACGTNGCPHYEYVYGYAGINDFGLCSDNSAYGFIKLKDVCLVDRDQSSGCQRVNPIAKAAWQFTRLHYPDLIHQTNLSQNPPLLPDDGPASLTSFIQIAEAFADLYQGLSVTLVGMNLFCLTNWYGRTIEPKKSWVRLYNPNGVKLAGGSRVKRIKISDEWESMSTVKDKGVYGTEYEYRTTQRYASGTGRLISSGVASYEPMIGGDENPFRQAETYNEVLKLAPDNHYYQEAPFGESFFPSPQIVYSKVTVKNLRYNTQGNLVEPTCVSTGTTVSEYYTAKDFPTLVNKTPLQVIPAKSSPIAAFLKLDYKEFLNASQGYCIENNDMHGKPKAQWVYDDKNQRISGVEYVYKTKMKDSNPSPSITNLVNTADSLDNSALVILRNGNLETRQLGVDFQVIADSRESAHETRVRGVALNFDNFMVGIFPAGAIVPLPVWETEKTRFRSMAITKVINRYALLDKVVAYDGGSRIETENLAYDAETGEVLLTRTYNEFGDPIYNLKYPAHFAYPGMRQAYENAGYEVINANIVDNNDGTLIQTPNGQAGYFHPGDELLVSQGLTSREKAWVLNVNSAHHQIQVIKDKGESLPFTASSTVKLKIIRSGKRNMQSFDIGSITLKTNPIQNGSLSIPSNSIVDASATEYSDNWFMQYIDNCTNAGVIGGSSPASISYNPYKYGRRGVWRAKKSWLHLKDRTPSTVNQTATTNIRQDGVYTAFKPFWNSAASGVWSKDESDWTWNSEATKHNNYGFHLEAKDPLNRYSAELPGYNNTRAIAVAANARYREIHFDGFEENYLDSFNICNGKRFRHFPAWTGGVIDSTYSHTGEYSFRVAASGTATHAAVLTVSPSADVTIPALSNPEVRSYQNPVPTFSPLNDSAYVVGAWIRTNDTYAENLVTYKRADNLNPRIEVKFYNSSNTLLGTTVLHPSGNVIDGWQRISGIASLPQNTYKINLELKNGTTANAYFDDLRIQPFRSAMKTYVYDLRSFRLAATLDDENYATFYEYNQEGMLERVKRETEAGVMTIQETRTGMKKL